MQIVVDFPWENAEDWLAELRRQGPGHDLHEWPDVRDPGCIEAAVVWTPTAELFQGMDRLRAIIVPGAGVDQLWRHVDRLPDVPIVRLADPIMATRMAEYVLSMVLDHHRKFKRYRRQQAERVWERHFHADPGDIRVGIMGLGVMGQAVADYLTRIGYDVTGWSRRPKTFDGLRTLAGSEALTELADRSDVLVCLLPLTDETRGILNGSIFKALPEGALVINAARGGHLVVPDLMAALDTGKLGGAVLDVFEDEPLAATSPLWAHPRITITPHIASLSNPVTGIGQIIRALDQLESGLTPDHLVDVSAGY